MAPAANCRSHGDNLIDLQLPKRAERFENFGNLLDAGFGAFAELAGEGTGGGAGGGEEFLDGGDLGAEAGWP